MEQMAWEIAGGYRPRVLSAQGGLWRQRKMRRKSKDANSARRNSKTRQALFVSRKCINDISNQLLQPKETIAWSPNCSNPKKSKPFSQSPMFLINSIPTLLHTKQNKNPIPSQHSTAQNIFLPPHSYLHPFSPTQAFPPGPEGP